MNIISEIVNLTGNYLKGIGVDSSVVDAELQDVTQALVLNLPKVCILKENRNGAGGNQTHIHVTGAGMKFFFKEDLLESNPAQFANDIREDVILFPKNLSDLKRIANTNHGVVRNFNIDTNSELIESFTYKKVGRIGTPGIQVQISKKNLDDSNFLNLRKCLFTNDFLILLKTEGGKKTIVIGMSNSDFNPRGFARNTVYQEVEKSKVSEFLVKETVAENTYHETNLREVDFNNIAKFNVNDEEDTSETSKFDLSTGIATRKKRTERHQDIVKLIALDLERKGYKLFENPVDCLAVKKDDKALLFEIKTLDGSMPDEKKQVQKAFSQLYYYEEFFVKEKINNAIQKIVVFESIISEKHISFFEKNEIKVFWIGDNKLIMDKHGVVEF